MHPDGNKCYVDAHPSMNLEGAKEACARIGAKLPTVLDSRDPIQWALVFFEAKQRTV